MRLATPSDVVVPDDLLAQIRRRYSGLMLVTTWGTRTLRYAPGNALGDGVEFVTLEERERADDVPSMLETTGAYRVRFGVAPERFEALFGARPTWSDRPIDDRAIAWRRDTLVPHPAWAWMSWATVVNPSPATVDRLWPLLDEAYALAVDAHARQFGRAAYVPRARHSMALSW